jgi:hypothetical protein
MKEFELSVQTIKENFTGEDSAGGLRDRSKYEETEQKMQLGKFIDNIDTPPVALNLRKWQEDIVMVEKLQKELKNRPVRVVVFGIATVHGIQSILDFTTNVIHTKQTELFALDINGDILKKVDALGLPNVKTLHEDAQRTSLENDSFDLVIRDHMGNCCPPNIDRGADREAVRILRRNGMSMTNITTSELLVQSVERNLVPYELLSKKFDKLMLQKFQTEFFDLNDIAHSTIVNTEAIRGQLLEIEPNNSFAIFGSGKSDIDEHVDLIGHGDWFRPLCDHVHTWISDGFEIDEIRSRSGTDSHVPKLSCLRHIVLLKKI